MKKWIALLLTLCLLTGCGALPEETVVTTVTEPEATVTDPVTEPTTEPVKEPSRLLQEMACVDGALFRVEAPVLEQAGQFQEVLLFGQDLLLLTVEEQEWDEEGWPTLVDFGLLLIDSSTGQQKARFQAQMPDAPAVQVCGDRIALTDWTGGAQLLDRSLKPLQKYEGKDSWGIMYIDAGGRYLYTVGGDGGTYRTELKTGARSSFLPGAGEIRVDSVHGNTLCLSYVDVETLEQKYGVMDMTTGRLTPMPFGGTYAASSCRGDLWMAWNYGEDAMHVMGWDPDPYVLSVGDATVCLSDGPGEFSVRTYGEDGSQQLKLYDRNGKFCTGFACGPEMGFLTEPLWCPALDGYLMTSVNEQGESQLLFLDLSIPVSGEDLQLQHLSETVTQTEYTALPEALYARAEQLSEKYDVHIRIGDQCQEQFGDFQAQRELEEQTVARGLNQLEAALSRYPEGFFAQLPYGNYREVEISLVGDLTATNIPEDADAFTSFAAFVNHYDGKHIMVLDITLEDLQQTFYHEISHIIDVRLEFGAKFRDSLYSEEDWAALNPKAFSYADSIYVMGDSYDDDGYESYFVDKYARTYPTEDRARVLEYATAGYEWIFDPSYAAPLREKLAYYSACIRDGFDTEGWPEELPWEIPLHGYRYGQKKQAA